MVKGLGPDVSEPKKLGQGYLSIEETGKLKQIVVRSVNGRILFKGILGKSSARVRPLTTQDNPNNYGKYKIKFTALVHAQKNGG